MLPVGTRELQRTAVKVLHRDAVKREALDAADVQRRHALPLRVDALAVNMYAAYGAEAMLDDVVVEGVGACSVFRRFELHLLARHEPQQRALALADRAISAQRARDLAFDVERNASAMTASGVVHGLFSLFNRGAL